MVGTNNCYGNWRTTYILADIHNSKWYNLIVLIINLIKNLWKQQFFWQSFGVRLF